MKRLITIGSTLLTLFATNGLAQEREAEVAGNGCELDYQVLDGGEHIRTRNTRYGREYIIETGVTIFSAYTSADDPSGQDTAGNVSSCSMYFEVDTSDNRGYVVRDLYYTVSSQSDGGMFNGVAKKVGHHDRDLVRNQFFNGDRYELGQMNFASHRSLDNYYYDRMVTLCGDDNKFEMRMGAVVLPFADEWSYLEISDLKIVLEEIDCSYVNTPEPDETGAGDLDQGSGIIDSDGTGDTSDEISF